MNSVCTGCRKHGRANRHSRATAVLCGSHPAPARTGEWSFSLMLCGWHSAPTRTGEWPSSHIMGCLHVKRRMLFHPGAGGLSMVERWLQTPTQIIIRVRTYITSMPNTPPTQAWENKTKLQQCTTCTYCSTTILSYVKKYNHTWAGRLKKKILSTHLHKLGKVRWLCVCHTSISTATCENHEWQITEYHLHSILDEKSGVVAVIVAVLYYGGP